MPQPNKDEKNLKGTLISVMVLGLMIVASWFAMFALYMERQ
ncbi:cytochrome c oxidase subunit 2A [Brevibacillus marinus]|nr:cytochrome c oxidase subunit 2A [Brevibacillus marinus]